MIGQDPLGGMQGTHGRRKPGQDLGMLDIGNIAAKLIDHLRQHRATQTIAPFPQINRD